MNYTAKYGFHHYFIIFTIKSIITISFSSSHSLFKLNKQITRRIEEHILKLEKEAKEELGDKF